MSGGVGTVVLQHSLDKERACPACGDMDGCHQAPPNYTPPYKGGV